MDFINYPDSAERFRVKVRRSREPARKPSRVPVPWFHKAGGTVGQYLKKRVGTC